MFPQYVPPASLFAIFEFQFSSMITNFLLKEQKAEYETWIYCLCRYDSKRIKIYTSKKINPKNWNKPEQRAKYHAKDFPNATEFNYFLKNIADHAEKIELDWKNKHKDLKQIPSLPEQVLIDGLKKYINKTNPTERETQNANSFWGYWDKLLYRMENGTRLNSKTGTPLSKKTTFQFYNTKRHLLEFERFTKTQIEFDKIDMIFYKNLMDFFTIKMKLKPNTIGKLITNIKVVLNEAIDDKLTTNILFRSKNFKSVNAKSETIFLNENEINEMLALDLCTTPSLERVRDMFIIGCYTGLRFSDLTKIKTTNIENDILEIQQTKTGGTVFIPLRPVAKNLLAKYGNTMPSISNQRFNEYLKEVTKLCPLLDTEITYKETVGGKVKQVKRIKHQMVSSHTARRSFATNEFKQNDISVSEIMAITGHKTEKSFYKYIRETPKDVALRTKDIWAKRIEKPNHLKAV